MALTRPPTRDILEGLSILSIYERGTGYSSRAHEYPSGERVLKCIVPSNHKNGDKHPSCAVNDRKGAFRCYGCGVAGGIIEMVMLMGKANSRQDAIIWLHGYFCHDAICPICSRTPAKSEEPLELKPQPIDDRAHGGNGKFIKLLNERLADTFSYHNEGGHLLYQVLRFEGDPPADEIAAAIAAGEPRPKNPKRFVQRRPCGNKRWIYHIVAACDPPRAKCPCQDPATPDWAKQAARLVPYRLPDIMRAAETKRSVFITEGERHADALRRIGLIATTNMGGAAFRYPPEWSAFFTGVPRIVLLPDADAPGRAAARERARLLSAPGRTIVTLDLYPDSDEGLDILDWLKPQTGEPPKRIVKRLQELVLAAEARLIPPLGTLSLSK